MSSDDNKLDEAYWIYIFMCMFIIPVALFSFFQDKDISAVNPIAVFLTVIFFTRAEKYKKKHLDDKGNTVYNYGSKEAKSWHLSSFFVYGLFTIILLMYAYLTGEFDCIKLFTIPYVLLGLVGVYNTCKELRAYLKIETE